MTPGKGKANRQSRQGVRVNACVARFLVTSINPRERPEGRGTWGYRHSC